MNSVLSLALALTALSRAKTSNANFREVLIWENLSNYLAIRARRRILNFAMDYQLQSDLDAIRDAVSEVL